MAERPHNDDVTLLIYNRIVEESPSNTDAWLSECMAIADAEVWRACKRGLPTSIDRSDLESCANEVIAENFQAITDGALMRVRLRSRLLDLIRRELPHDTVPEFLLGSPGRQVGRSYYASAPSVWEHVRGTLQDADFNLLFAKYGEGLSEAEIAADTGVSQQAISERLKKLIKNVQAQLVIAPR